MVEAVTSLTCDVCGSGFAPASEDQRRCSETCRDFARQHRQLSPKGLADLWRRQQQLAQPCPSGKAWATNSLLRPFLLLLIIVGYPVKRCGYLTAAPGDCGGGVRLAIMDACSCCQGG